MFHLSRKPIVNAFGNTISSGREDTIHRMKISACDGGSGMAEQGGDGCIRITEIGGGTGEGMPERYER